MKRSILVVIPTLNEARTIEGVIASLLADPPRDARLDLVVADGGSGDGTQAIVERIAAARANVRLLHNPRRLQSAAVNLAARQFGAGAELLVRCDAHAIYPTGFLSRLVEAIDRTGADAVVVPMDSTGDRCVQRAVAWVSDTLIGSGGSAHRGGRRSGYVDHGHHAAFRMQSFLRAGGYDETYTHNEDAELDCRQRALGSRIWLDSDIRLAYHPRATLGALWKQYFNYGRGRSRTVRRHPGSWRPRQLAVPANLALGLVALAVSPLLPAALVLPGAYLGALAWISVWIALRQRSTCGLLAGPAAFVMHNAWALGFFNGLITVREKPWSVEAAEPLVLAPATSGSRA
ncbi:glycosyltransferase family 2 protein [Derxia gummosa]|uniref:Glycosyltransferase family 2 protein n=1 Tax=Derxia gummosa DSM 723 TaxID=1121388 RepID=A0A9U5CXH0_9BURK|nr:glycosyltransferase family 2 protein [Derxia gummosa]